ncbi:MAG: cobalt ECF transporter T component CbiQ [Deltaproteobacteria bacterium]|nr:cobalt ECF transporter T component CbiQ [Deltaproteobacteria bacterium]
MAAGVHVIHLPLPVPFLVLGGTLLLWLAARRLLKFLTGREEMPEGGGEPDYSIPLVDSQAQGDSPFHRWDPRIKVAALLCFMFCAAFLQQLPCAAAALVVGGGAVVFARIPLRYPLRRLLAMGGFLGMFVVVMPVTVPVKSGDTLLVFNHLSFLPFSVRGLNLALLICIKAVAVALLVDPLLATAPFSHTVKALVALRVPPIVCQMILLAYRYVFVFQNESNRMARGMSARGFQKKTDLRTLRNMGNSLGMLLVRSFERTQRVHDAMVSRGYGGTLPGQLQFHARPGDWLKGAFWVLAGIALLVADRLCTLPTGFRF